MGITFKGVTEEALKTDEKKDAVAADIAKALGVSASKVTIKSVGSDGKIEYEVQTSSAEGAAKVENTMKEVAKGEGDAFDTILSSVKDHSGVTGLTADDVTAEAPEKTEKVDPAAAPTTLESGGHKTAGMGGIAVVAAIAMAKLH